MYTLKPYFFALVSEPELQFTLARYPDVKKVNGCVVTEKNKQISLLELGTHPVTTAKALAQEFLAKRVEFWEEPENLDFSFAAPHTECNSFVMVVYGHYDEVSAMAEKWKKASMDVAKKVYPVIVSCMAENNNTWVEFRGHTELPEEDWYEDIRKISKVFTKSTPTFYRASKIRL